MNTYRFEFDTQFLYIKTRCVKEAVILAQADRN